MDCKNRSFESCTEPKRDGSWLHPTLKYWSGALRIAGIYYLNGRHSFSKCALANWQNSE